MKVHSYLIDYGRDLRDSGHEVNLREYLTHYSNDLYRVITCAGISALSAVGGAIGIEMGCEPTITAQTVLTIGGLASLTAVGIVFSSDIARKEIKLEADFQRKKRREGLVKITKEPAEIVSE